MKEGGDEGMSVKKIASCYTFTAHNVCWTEHKNYIIVSVPVSIKLLQKHWKTVSRVHFFRHL